MIKEKLKEFSDWLLENYETDEYEGVKCWYRKKDEIKEIIDTELLVCRFIQGKNQIKKQNNGTL